MLDYIVNEVKPDLLIWTGDNSPHNTYELTLEQVTNYTIAVSEMIATAVQGTNITVLPIQGNHDTYPVDQQDFASPGMNYPINHFKGSWKNWLDDEAFEKIGEYGYYSMDLKLKSGKAVPHGAKVIAINTNSCDELNPYELVERDDTGHQYEWLKNELNEIESNDGVAFIIAHIDPSDCQHQWGVRFRSLMDRYQHIVRFTLSGHVHTEYFEVVNSMSTPSTPIMMSVVAGSLVPVFGGNPSFMTHDLDVETLLPLNMYSHWFDLEKANTEGEPVWVYHDYVNFFNLTDVSPDSMLSLAKRTKEDKDFASQFKWLEKRQAKDLKVLSDDEQLELFCTLASSEHHEKNECLSSKGETIGS